MEMTFTQMHHIPFILILTTIKIIQFCEAEQPSHKNLKAQILFYPEKDEAPRELKISHHNTMGQNSITAQDSPPLKLMQFFMRQWKTRAVLPCIWLDAAL